VFARCTDLWRAHLRSAGTTANSDSLCHLAPTGDRLLRNSGLTALLPWRKANSQTRQLDVAISLFYSNVTYGTLCWRGRGRVCLANIPGV
jgi:hypothetical protein